MKGTLAAAVVNFLAASRWIGQNVYRTDFKHRDEVSVVTLEQALSCLKCLTEARHGREARRFPYFKQKHLRLHCGRCHEFKGHEKITVVKKSDPPRSTCH